MTELAMAPDAAQSFEWRSGGVERLVWTNANREWWAAVWPAGKGFKAWVSGLKGRRTKPHRTEAEGKAWCEEVLRAVLLDPAAIKLRDRPVKPQHGA